MQTHYPVLILCAGLMLIACQAKTTPLQTQPAPSANPSYYFLKPPTQQAFPEYKMSVPKTVSNQDTSPSDTKLPPSFTPKPTVQASDSPRGGNSSEYLRSPHVSLPASSAEALPKPRLAAGSLLWQNKPSETIAPALAQSGAIFKQKLFTLFADGHLNIQDLETGQLLQAIKLESPADTPLVLDTEGNIFLGTQDGTFHALNPEGQKNWRIISEQTSFFHEAAPALDEQGILYLGGQRNLLSCLEPDGSIRWGFETLAPVASSPIIAQDRVYFLGQDGIFYALKRESGEEIWQFHLKQALAGLQPALNASGEIILGAGDMQIYALNSQGQIEWLYTLENNLAHSPVIGPDGSVYLVDNQGKIYCLDLIGKLKWSYLNQSPVTAPPIIGEDQLLYFGTAQGLILALNPNGEEIWEYALTGAISGDLLLDSQGVLYAQSNSGEQVALQSFSQGLAQGDWPCKYRNQRHSSMKEALQ